MKKRGKTEYEDIQLTKRRWRRRWLLVSIFIGVCILGGILLISVYRGPRSLADVPTAMPGVPIFPLATLGDNNVIGQYAMAAPLLVLRMQGAQRVETVVLNAPADQFFVRDWYLRFAPSQQWTLVGEYDIAGTHRIVYSRRREGLQVVIGRSVAAYTPVHLTYLDGMTDTQLRRLGASVPTPQPSTTPPRPATGSEPPQQRGPIPAPVSMLERARKVRDILMPSVR